MVLDTGDERRPRTKRGEDSSRRQKRIKSSKHPCSEICCVMLPNQLSKAKQPTTRKMLFEALKIFTVGMLLGLRAEKVKRNLRRENTETRQR